ncbi:hypothetical protein HMN09_01299200 [Mycena chlorophos]|uniref:glutathione transferase n=1 Tax=Mycena chlorophos TaxID=658473 RepID=A0A8H6S1Q2_MYCCL|nr:hypothetical protein HMN09_01299200 [Mycena chlorophos]
MVLKLYSSLFFGPGGHAGVVALVLAEKQVPFEDIPVNAEVYKHKDAEHLERQPFGQIPVLDDNGFILYETRAICRYIVEKYSEKGPSLLPGPSFEERALFEQAISVEIINFQGAVVPIFVASLKKKRRGLAMDVAAVEAGVEILVQRLEVYEKILSRQKFVAGDE